MILRLPQREYRHSGEQFHYCLMSDLHIGSAHCDKDLIRSELEWARENKARVFINGDIFDLILPKDHKRFVPSVLDEALRGKDAVLNATLDLGAKILKPYADLIDMIGFGNHESAIVRHHSHDIISLLIERLSTPKHKIFHGAYGGSIVQTFRRKQGNGCRYVIRYFHGKGGDAPVTGGMIDYNRAATWVRDADVIWGAHKHTRFVRQVKEERVPEAGELFELRKVWWIQSGAYDTGNHKQHDTDGNYQSDYGSEKGFAPQGTGGVKLVVSIKNGNAYTRTETEVLL